MHNTQSNLKKTNTRMNTILRYCSSDPMLSKDIPSNNKVELSADLQIKRLLYAPLKKYLSFSKLGLFMAMILL